MNTYQQELRALLSPAECRLFSKLSTPLKIQAYLDTLSVNYELEGETLFSPRRALKAGTVHCIEAALLAATSLAYHGHRPLLLDFQTVEEDEDHVITVFKHAGKWGAISKTNHPLMRWRDPVYKTIRELAMSYFHEYYLPSGMKSLKAYSRPFDMRRYPLSCWVIASENLEWVAEDLDASPHVTIATDLQLSKLRNADSMELKLLEIPEWTRDGKKIGISKQRPL